jgi:hypothetical protein
MRQCAPHGDAGGWFMLRRPIDVLRTLGLVLALAVAPLAGAAPSEPSRGQMLYENHCQGCHDSVLHVRTDHRATSPAEVHDWVRYWAQREELGWSTEDVIEVSDVLVRKYYRFPPPAR